MYSPFLFFIDDGLLRIFYNISKCSGLQTVFQGSLGTDQVLVKNLVDVSPYRTVRVWLFMKMEEADRKRANYSTNQKVIYAIT